MMKCLATCHPGCICLGEGALPGWNQFTFFSVQLWEYFCWNQGLSSLQKLKNCHMRIDATSFNSFFFFFPFSWFLHSWDQFILNKTHILDLSYSGYQCHTLQRMGKSCHWAAVTESAHRQWTNKTGLPSIRRESLHYTVTSSLQSSSCHPLQPAHTCSRITLWL